VWTNGYPFSNSLPIERDLRNDSPFIHLRGKLNMTHSPNPIICTKCGKIFKHMIRIGGFWYCYECKFDFFEKMPQFSNLALSLVFGKPKEVKV
jgi:hypothetical protein